MPVITLTITESPIQIVSGIPQMISMSANIPSTIFYTLDGTEPTTSSDVYISSIKLPVEQHTIVLKAFATDGTDTSLVVSRTYKNTTFSKNRRPHDKIENLSSNS